MVKKSVNVSADDSIQFIHMADTHLGYFRYPKGDEDGVNQRMMDFHEAFLQSVDKAIAAKPDFIIHAGDIVDTHNPPNRSREIMAEGISRIHKAGIPLIVLSGTHDTPKIKRDINLFKLFKYDNVYMMSEPDQITLNIKGKTINIYGVPYSYDFEEMKTWFNDTMAEELDKDAYNILVLHCDIGGVDKLKFSDKLLVLPDNIGDRYDYVAMGHFHSYYHWGNKSNVVFAGATERKNYDEIGEDRYIHKVTMSKGKEVALESIQLDIRPMAKIFVDLSEVADIEMAYKIIEKSVRQNKDALLDGVILPIILRCNFVLYQALNMPYIKGLFPNAFWCEPSWENVNETKKDNAVTDLSGDLLGEWKNYIDKMESDKAEKKWHYGEGDSFLKRAMEANNDSN